MLDVAGRVFAQRGYHGASMDEIAAGVGISKPVLYASFTSKQGLYVAYVHRAGGKLRERLRQVAVEEPDPTRRLEAGLDGFFAFVDEQRDSWSLLYHEATAQGGAVAAEVAALRAQIVRTVKALLDECVAERGRPPGDPNLDAFAHALVGAGESLANWWLAHPDVSRPTLVGWLMAATTNALVGQR